MNISPIEANNPVPAVAKSATAYVPPPPDFSVSQRPQQDRTDSAGPADGTDDVKQMVVDMQNQISMMNVSLEFSTYGESNEKISVVVTDKKSGEVIREIPSKEIQDLYTKMSELTGMIFNKRA